MAYDNTTALSVEIVRPDDPLVISERVAVAAFLASYAGGTRVSYTTDRPVGSSQRQGRSVSIDPLHRTARCRRRSHIGWKPRRFL